MSRFCNSSESESLIRLLASLKLAPVHAFVDLTIIPRLSPFLASLPLPQSEPYPSRPSTPRPRTPRNPAPLSPLRSEYPPFQPSQSAAQVDASQVEIECGLVRIEIRCPPPTTKRRHKVPWTEPTRSGILVLDVAGLSTSSSGNGTKACWDRAAFLFFSASGQSAFSFLGTILTTDSAAKRASGFLSISALPPDEDDNSLPPSQPVVRVVKLTSGDDTSTTSIDCRLPLIRSALDKPTLDGLQLFADDLTQWSVLASRDDFSGGSSSGSSTPNPRIVGSRYFGAKSFARRRAGSESDEGSTIEGPRAMTMKVVVSDSEFLVSFVPLLLTMDCTVVVDLFVARKTSTTPRHLRALVSDLQLQVDLLKNSKVSFAHQRRISPDFSFQNDMHIEAVAVDLRLEDTTVEASPTVILSRAKPRNLVSSLLRANCFLLTLQPDERVKAAFQCAVYERCREGDWEEGVESQSRFLELRLPSHV